jgi:hypothetical protein
MKILVCGGTRYSDARRLNLKLDSLAAEYGDTELISSCARGVDHLAHLWAKSCGVHIQRIPAQRGPEGIMACNVQMLAQKPDMVLGFPGGPGAAHMLEIARAAGVRVEEVD